MIYTLKQWEKEEKIRRLSYHPHYGSCRLPCPNCKVIGFYAPREDDGGRKYRGCKFCGFWQEVDGGEPYGGEPYRCIALHCESCGIYDWTQPKEEKDFKPCEICGLKYKKFKWAIDYPKHLFWQLKQKFEKCTVHK